MSTSDQGKRGDPGDESRLDSDRGTAPRSNSQAPRRLAARWRPRAGAAAGFLIPLAAALFVYRRALFTGFLLDDYQWIEPIGLSDLFATFSGSWGYGVAFRPLTRWSFALDQAVFGEWAPGWRFVGFALHAANAAFLCAIATRWTGHKGLGIAAAVLFAVYPAVHENVAWISGRTHLLGLFFALCTGAAVDRSFDAIGRARRVATACACAAAVAALFSYESAFVLPAFVLAVLVSRATAGFPLSGWRVRAGLPLLFWIVALVWRQLALGGELGHVNEHHGSVVQGAIENALSVAETLSVSMPLRVSLGVAFAVGGASVLLGRRFGAHRGVDSVFLRRLALALCMAIVTYAPFVIVRGVAHRFLYSAVWFGCLALVHLAGAAFAGGRGRKTAMSAALCGLFAVSVYEAGTFARQYDEVSRTTDLIRQQVREAVPEWTTDTDLVFVGIPIKHDRVYAYATYFDAVITPLFPEPHGRLIRVDGLDHVARPEPGRNQIVFEFRGMNVANASDAGVRFVEQALVTVDGSGRRYHATIEAMVLIELATDPAGAHVESYRALVARGAMAILHPDRARPWRLLDPVAYHHSLLPRSVDVVARPAVGDPQKLIVEGTLLLVLSPPPADAQVRADLLFVEGAVWEVAEPLSFAFQRTGERVVEVLRPGKYRIGAYGVPTFVGPVGAPR